MVGFFTNLEERHHSFLPAQAPISIEVYPPSIQYFSFKTSQGIKNTKFASRASSPNHHLSRRGMESLSNTGIKAQGKKIMLFGEMERFQSRPRKIHMGTN
ncbi:hypothetical protein O181_055074 [Austropuccinia psidii MF-1]|uniref:Uncharacterized protein n=1 Tax=Austropuccinia psidii MF-1 TaxID=1389203 RepID=A0A9Q3E5T9_9BASI|nr:hypothetical protein [Austropuccinia psidii MF-1]